MEFVRGRTLNRMIETLDDFLSITGDSVLFGPYHTVSDDRVAVECIDELLRFGDNGSRFAGVVYGEFYGEDFSASKVRGFLKYLNKRYGF